MRRPTKKAPKRVAAPARAAAPDEESEREEEPQGPQQRREPAALDRPEGCDDATWQMLVGRYNEHASVVFEIMMAWEDYHQLSEVLARPLPDKSLAARQERAREVAFAAIRFAHRFEGVCNSRHRSWYLHLFVYVVPRQIEKYGELWPFSTAALESRGARIKRTKVCWRSYSDTPTDRKSDRRQRVTIFKQKYRSAPTLQIMRMISAAEEIHHNGKGRGASRFKATGRFKKCKIEADHSTATSYVTNPFASLSAFLTDAELQAGRGFTA